MVATIVGLVVLTLISLWIYDPFSNSLWMDWLDQTIRQKMGIAIHHVKLLGCLAFSYPLADILRRIPIKYVFIRNISNILISVFFTVFILDLWYGLQTVLISATGTYIIVKYIKGRYMPFIAFIFLMTHLSINHIYRQTGKIIPEKDVTGIQMVLCMKLSAFAWNIYDGQQNESILRPQQKEYALKKLPSFFDYLGYVFFFPSFFVGPSFDLVDYYRWLAKDVTTSPSKENDLSTFGGCLIHKYRYYAAKKFFLGLFYLYMFQWMGMRYSATFVFDDQFFQLTYIRRLSYLILLALTHRFKYYGIWQFAEGACVLSGLGESTRDSYGNIIRSSLENINPYDFETAQSTKQLLEAWNKGTNRWLKYYVYWRLVSFNKKPNIMSSIATFMTSALWHGLSFLTGAFVQILGRYLRRYVRPFFLTKDMQPTRYKVIYDILSWATTQITWAYIVQPFVLLDLSNSFRFWQRYYFFVHVGIVCLTILFLSPFRTLLVQKSLKIH
ncbi:hypothetical protein PCK2_000820 [Pneumocystis canis]|nr:hypothetical protein PCK2_000820 [Pneumocystis canis]